MKKVSIFVIVCLLALSGIMAAMAYSNATVTNAAQLSIVNTNSALLALSPNPAWSWTNPPGNKDATAYMENGELKFNFGKGALGNQFGLQPNSVYEWIPLFEMRNMSKEKIRVTVSVKGDLKPYITLGTCGQSQAIGGGSPVAGHKATADWGVQSESITFDINPINAQGDMWNIRNIAVKISVPSEANFSAKNIADSIIVEAIALP